MTEATWQRPPSARGLTAVAWLLVGALVAVVGLLPWIVTGMRLPLQNRWAAETLPGDMPVALLPFNVGLALAWCGWRPAARFVGWVGAAAVLWLLPAALATLVVVGVNRLVPPLGDLFVSARSTLADGLVGGWLPVLVALVVGAGLRLALDELRRRRTPVTP